jgi:hypothetical protein
MFQRDVIIPLHMIFNLANPIDVSSQEIPKILIVLVVIALLAAPVSGYQAAIRTTVLKIIFDILLILSVE